MRIRSAFRGAKRVSRCVLESPDSGRSAATIGQHGDFHQWIEYDLLYVQHMSFVLDLKILAATACTLGGKVGSVPARWLVPSATSRRGASSQTPLPAASARQDNVQLDRAS